MVPTEETRVVIAEDDADLRELLAARLQVFGFQVFAAEGGREALDMVRTHAPIDIVISDIRMPAGSGLDLLKELKQKSVLAPKVFMVTGQSSIPKEVFFSLGAEGFFSKPYDTRLMIEIARKSLLPNRNRWQMAPSFNPEHELKAKLNSVGPSGSSLEFGLGRGGFYIKTSQPLREEGTVNFEISAEPFHLTGIGTVKWRARNPGGEVYAGIEFLHIRGEGVAAIYEWIEKNQPQAYIPLPESVVINEQDL